MLLWLLGNYEIPSSIGKGTAVSLHGKISDPVNTVTPAPNHYNLNHNAILNTPPAITISGKSKIPTGGSLTERDYPGPGKLQFTVKLLIIIIPHCFLIVV